MSEWGNPDGSSPLTEKIQHIVYCAERGLPHVSWEVFAKNLTRAKRGTYLKPEEIALSKAEYQRYRRYIIKHGQITINEWAKKVELTTTRSLNETFARKAKEISGGKK